MISLRSDVANLISYITHWWEMITCTVDIRKYLPCPFEDQNYNRWRGVEDLVGGKLKINTVNRKYMVI